MKNKTSIASLSLCLAVLLSAQQTRASSFILNDFVITVNSEGTAITGGLKELRFGFFATGFTPTASNATSWLSNFTGVSGYFDPSGPEWSASINIDNNSVYPVNTQLVAMVFNFADDTTITNTLLQAPSTRGAIITNSAWKITTAQAIDINQYYFDDLGSYVNTETSRVSGTTTALVGTYSSGNLGLTTVPEPSTGALMVIGAVGLVALRRLRKV